MVYSGVPSLIIALVLFAVIGAGYKSETVDAGDVALMLDTISGGFRISPWLLLPPLMVIFMVVFRIPALPALLGGALLGAVVAALAQGSSLTEIIQASFNGFVSETGVEKVDGLLSRGGLMSMMSTIALVMSALAFGGVMEGSGMLEALAESILKMARSVGSLVVATIATCIGMNVIAPDQYLSIVVPGRMYRNAYTKRHLHPKNLSRLLEGSGTLSSPLVPWNTCGAFMGSVLGVSAGAYFVYAFFNLINPLVCIFLGYTGWTMDKMTPEEERQMLELGEIK